MSRLNDKVAVITGGAGGIGRAAGRLFASEGANVLLVDLSEAALKDAVKEIGSNRVSYCVGDVTNPADNDKFVSVATERYGGVDTFLANAGIEGIVKPITEYDVEMFDKVMAVNVRGVWLGLKSAIPAIDEARRRQHHHHVIGSGRGWRGRSFAVCHEQTRRDRHDAFGCARSARR